MWHFSSVAVLWFKFVIEYELSKAIGLQLFQLADKSGQLSDRVYLLSQIVGLQKILHLNNENNILYGQVWQSDILTL